MWMSLFQFRWILVWGCSLLPCFLKAENAAGVAEKVPQERGEKKEISQEESALYGFKEIDVTLSEEQKALLASMRISNTITYDNFGALDIFQKECEAFLIQIGNDAEKAAAGAALILGVVQQMIRLSGKETGWVSLRAYVPGPQFQIPRWHTDGNFFLDETLGTQVKLAINLKGDGTYFLKAPLSFKKKFKEVDNKFIRAGGDRQEQRKALDTLVKSQGEGVQIYELPLYQAAAFNVGQEERSAIHSEPDFKKERLFLSVVPGSFAQVEGLRMKWSEPKSRMR